MMSLPLLGALRSLAVLLASVDRGAAAVKLKRMMATPRNAQQLEAMLVRAASIVRVLQSTKLLSAGVAANPKVLTFNTPNPRDGHTMHGEYWYL